jgi:RNA polymerase sigma-70 factor (ECF subfamily)
VARRFVAALRAGDKKGLLALMTDGALLIADGGGRVPAGTETQRGAGLVSQLLVGYERATRVLLERRDSPMPEYEVAWLNGDPAVLTLVSGKLLFATVLHLDGENVAGVYRIMNPDKLASLGRPTLLPHDVPEH